MNASLPADIFEAMHELLHLFRSRMREDMESMEPGLTPNEVRVLMYVGRHPGRTQRDLVDHSHMDKAQLARMLAQLQEQGWLDREPDARDRRVRCLSLSPRVRPCSTGCASRARRWRRGCSRIGSLPRNSR